jgi:hypothetical protein
MTRATAIAEKPARMRLRMGVMGAYGANAEELGLGDRTPPSRRTNTAARVLSRSLSAKASASLSQW